MKPSIEIIVPPRASTGIGLDLIALTEYLDAKVPDCDAKSFGLGGEYGYGSNYENDVFMIHRFCWCDKMGCPWCDGDAPNFLHKASGLSIKWYKWIGRSMEYSRKIDAAEWSKIFNECVKSIS